MMNFELTDKQIKLIVDQQVRWSLAASEAIDKKDEKQWEVCIKSMQAIRFTLHCVSEELEEHIRREVRKRLVEIDGSEEEYKEKNKIWHEWQRELRKRRGGK